jgi:flagellar biosynthesis protein FliR
VSLTFLEANAFLYLAVFCRIGTAMMVLPGFGEIFVPSQIRLVLALMTSFVLAPVLASYYPALPSELGRFAGILLGEIGYGLALGSIVRIFFATLQIAGNIIASQTGLSFVQNFDPTQGIQGALLSSFLTMLGLTLIFQSDLHYLMLAGLVDAYSVLKPGVAPLWGDFAHLATTTVDLVFRIGIEMSAPFIVFSLVFYAASGAISRLLPQIQIFFLVAPLNIIMGVGLLMLTLGSIMSLFLSSFGTALSRGWL